MLIKLNIWVFNNITVVHFCSVLLCSGFLLEHILNSYIKYGQSQYNCIHHCVSYSLDSVRWHWDTFRMFSYIKWYVCRLVVTHCPVMLTACCRVYCSMNQEVLLPVRLYKHNCVKCFRWWDPWIANTKRQIQYNTMKYNKTRSNKKISILGRPEGEGGGGERCIQGENVHHNISAACIVGSIGNGLYMTARLWVLGAI